MPRLVAKITHDDDTESSFGPFDVAQEWVEDFIAFMTPHEQKRQGAVEQANAEAIAAEQEDRSAAAAAANQAAIAAASETEVE